jgi:hypothetical protein
MCGYDSKLGQRSQVQRVLQAKCVSECLCLDIRVSLADLHPVRSQLLHYFLFLLQVPELIFELSENQLIAA